MTDACLWQDPTRGGFVHLLPRSLKANCMRIAMKGFVTTGVRYLDRRSSTPALGDKGEA